MEKSNVILISILVMASLFSKSNSLRLWGLTVDQLTIQGTVHCSLDGDTSAPPVPNALVFLTCGGSNATLAEAVTDPVGNFDIVVNTISTILVDPSDCRVNVNLPTGTCKIYPPDGVLVASINFVDFTITSLLTIANYAVGAFLDPSIS